MKQKSQVGESILDQASQRTVRDNIASYGSYDTNHSVLKCCQL